MLHNRSARDTRITKLIRKFKSLKLKTQLIFSFSVLIAVSLLVLGIISYYTSYKSILQQSTTFNQQLTNQMTENINLYFNDIMNISDSLTNNSSVKYYGDYFSSMKSDFSTDNIKNAFFSTLSKSNENDIEDINIIYNGKTLATLYSLYDNSKLQKIADYYNISDIYLNSKIVPYYETNNFNQPSFSAVRSVYSPDEKDAYRSIIIVSFSFDQLDQIFRKYKSGSNLDSYILDRNGVVQYSFDRKQIGKKLLSSDIVTKNGETRQSFRETIGREEYLVSPNRIENADMYVVTTEPFSQITASARTIKVTTILLIIFFIFAAIELAVLLSGAITKPLNVLVEDMATVGEGNFVQFPQLEASSDIRALSGKFNEMVVKINKLLNDINEYNQQERKLEFEVLESQINPHFLYNTLDSINSMAILCGQREIMKMTVALSKLLRLSLNGGKEFITIGDEIEHVKNYIYIQQIRYKDKFDVSFEVDPGILNFRIIKLVLQPLVENAIYHGIAPRDGMGHIVIRGFIADGNINLLVSDNGVGIDGSKLEQINDRLQRSADNESSSIGLFNTNERFRLYYGNMYILKLFSKKNEGTTVKLLLPLDEGEKND